MMKYLFLLLVTISITTCAKSAEQQVYESEEAKNLAFRDKAVSNFLYPPPRIEEPIKELISRKDYSQEAVEFFEGPYLTKEILALRWQLINDSKLYSRLVRVEDNLSSITNGEISIGYYAEILLDPQDNVYYLGLIRPAPLEVTHALPYKIPASRERFVFLSNLSPAETLLADAVEGKFYIRRIVPIPDLYKGYGGNGKYIYSDSESKIKPHITPITNIQTGDVAYKIIHPENGKPFYMARYMELSGDYGYDLESKGGLVWPYYNIEAVWQELIPGEPIGD